MIGSRVAFALRPLMKPTTQTRKLLALVLSLLLVVFMTAEVAHNHASGAVDLSAAAHCQLCAVAHVGSISQPSWLTAHVQHLIGQVALAEPSLTSRLAIPTAFIRPPPAVVPAHA